MGKIHRIANGTRKNFAARLKQYRELRYRTAVDFAFVLGIDPQRYRSWENAIAEPSMAMLLRICQLLECTPNDLLLGFPKRGAGNGGKTRRGKAANPVQLKPRDNLHIRYRSGTTSK